LLSLAQEIMFLLELSAQNDAANVICLRDLVASERGKQAKDVFLVYDFMETSLSRVVQAGGDILQPVHVAFVAYQLLRVRASAIVSLVAMSTRLF
jgi:hypothetical protein